MNADHVSYLTRRSCDVQIKESHRDFAKISLVFTGCLQRPENRIGEDDSSMILPHNVMPGMESSLI